MSRPFLIDTDTASDDAVALIMALRAPDVHVAAITVVAGNVPVAQGVRNALYAVELCGAHVPVFEGAARPLARDLEDATFFHGKDGLGDCGYAPTHRSKADDHAVDAIVQTIRAHPGLVLVTLGPLTNIALALRQAPDIVKHVDRTIVMGGAMLTVGNVTPAAEYNIWVDPDAAREVLHSGLRIELVGWELCRKDANLNDEEMRRLRQLDTPVARFTLDCNRIAIAANHRQSGDPGLALPDPVAMAIALDPSVCTRRSAHFVEVETGSALTRGMTVVDALNVTGDGRNRAVWHEARERGLHTTICWEIDIAAWKALLFRSLS